ncbi:hypothetical protein L7F22_009947 [Adiantum nelumboides]|nr:hypothetical protein [Adiantum nelumboides]
MDLTGQTGATNQLLVSHYNNISCSMQAETASHPSFGPMMALMTAEQLDLDKKCEQQQLQGDPVGSHFMHEYYDDPYQVTVFQGDNSHDLQGSHDELSYEQLVIASCVQAQAVDIAGAELKHKIHGDEEEEEKQEEGDLQRSMHMPPSTVLATGTMNISRKCEAASIAPAVCHASAAVLRSLDEIVERRALAAGHVVDMKSGPKEELVENFRDRCCTSSANVVDEERNIREKIVAHPDYRRLVMAYISCRKVGAPPDVARRLDELSKEYDTNPQLLSLVSKAAADPELDYFMKAYCRALHQYEEELSKPFNEAMAFIQTVELQISQLVMPTSGASTLPGNDGMSIVMHAVEDEMKDEGQLQDIAAAGEGDDGEVDEEGDEEVEEGGSCCGEVLDYVDSMEAAAAGCYSNTNMHYMQEGQQAADEQERQLKEQLLRRYRGYITTLKHEFMKKKKKGKLPKDARQRLLDWWHDHYKWPYPSVSPHPAIPPLNSFSFVFFFFLFLRWRFKNKERVAMLLKLSKVSHGIARAEKCRFEENTDLRAAPAVENAELMGLLWLKNVDLRDEKNVDLMVLLWLKNTALRASAAENADLKR